LIDSISIFSLEGKNDRMMKTFEEIIAESSGGQRELIPVLHRLQTELGHVPPAAIPAVARHLRISEAEVFGVLTFYKGFAIEPKGKNIITVCLGTACHVRGGVRIVEEFERRLGIPAGRTTPDRQFTLESVNCLGCCAIGPVVVVNGNYHAQVALKDVETIIAQYASGPGRS
jgi:NADH:ubiquinone oxidoreductase subunit E